LFVNKNGEKGTAFERSERLRFRTGLNAPRLPDSNSYGHLFLRFAQGQALSLRRIEDPPVTLVEIKKGVKSAFFFREKDFYR
jgi:hypothetical protein